MDLATPPTVPPGWATATLSQVTQPTRLKHDPRDCPDLPFIGMEHVEAHTMRLHGTVLARTMNSNAVHFQAGDVLYGRLRPYLNKVFRPDFEGLCSAEFIVFPSSEHLSGRFLAYFLNSSAFVNFSSHLNEGDRPRVDFAQIGLYPLQLPPLPEQHRIVAEIERQFSLLDAGVANLQRVRANLKRYRASTLQAACTGLLVPTEAEQARAEGRDYEPAAALLARILAERRERWEAEQLAKMEAQGKPPRDDKWKAKYQEPAAPTPNGLPELPKDWCWASLNQLASDSGYGTSEKCDYIGAGFPVLRIPNIAKGAVDLNDLKYTRAATQLNANDALSEGDLLIVRTNGSKSLIGRGAVVKTPFQMPHYFASYLIRFRLLKPIEAYISSIWHSSYVRQWVERTAATSAGQYNISMSALSGLALPLPPLNEQARIVAEVERRLSVVDQLERTVAANLKRAERLRQGILKEAFAGRLVPQDSADEPAQALLERVKAEREAQVKTPAKSSRRKEKADAANGLHDAPGTPVPSGYARRQRGTADQAPLQPDLFSPNGT